MTYLGFGFACFGVWTGTMALLAFLQALTGEPFVNSEKAKAAAAARSVPQFRAESAAGGLTFLGVTLAAFGIPFGDAVLWTGLVVMACGQVAVRLVRRRFAPRP